MFRRRHSQGPTISSLGSGSRAVTSQPSLASSPPRWHMWVNPQDAARLGLEDGAPALVRVRVGELAVPVKLTSQTREGVVSLPHGWWQDLPGARMKAARAQGGVNSDLVSDDQVMDPVSGNAVLNGIPAEVSPAY